MKKLVWVAGLVLGFALLFPNGIDVFSVLTPPAVDTVSAEPDAKLAKILSKATAAERRRVVSVYTGLKTVLERDNGTRVNTTEKWEAVHAATLQMAVDTPGKYEGLDAAIEAVFHKAVQDKNTDSTVVNPVSPEMQAKLLHACDVVIASAQ